MEYPPSISRGTRRLRSRSHTGRAYDPTVDIRRRRFGRRTSTIQRRRASCTTESGSHERGSEAACDPRWGHGYRVRQHRRPPAGRGLGLAHPAGAMHRLVPPWQPMRVVKETESLADGTAILGLPAGLRWIARHDPAGYDPPHQFRDVLSSDGLMTLPPAGHRLVAAHPPLQRRRRRHHPSPRHRRHHGAGRGAALHLRLPASPTGRGPRRPLATPPPAGAGPRWWSR